jgi:nitrogen regulatory protein PII
VKLVTGYFPPARLEPLKRALWEKGWRAFSISPAEGLGLQRGRLAHEDEFVSAFRPQVRLEVACRDAELESLVELLLDTARTGRVGDGKIWVTDLADVIRVRTGERGDAAL